MTDDIASLIEHLRALSAQLRGSNRSIEAQWCEDGADALQRQTRLVTILSDREFEDHTGEPVVTSNAAFHEILHLRERIEQQAREIERLTARDAAVTSICALEAEADAIEAQMSKLANPNKTPGWYPWLVRNTFCPEETWVCVAYWTGREWRDQRSPTDKPAMLSIPLKCWNYRFDNDQAAYKFGLALQANATSTSPPD